MMGFGMVFGLLFLILIVGGVILLALWLVKGLFPAGPGSARSQSDRELSPQKILDQRYARAEHGGEGACKARNCGLVQDFARNLL